MTNNQSYIDETGKIYGRLFNDYNDKLFNDSVELFLARHRRWNFDLGWFKGKVCLDAGCGGGRFVVALANLSAKEVRGIDISPAAVAVANERLQERKLNNCLVIEASVLNIPFSDNYFDYVVCSGVIHHTPEPFKAFQELTRVLKPGGKLFLSVYGRGGWRWFYRCDLWRYTVCKLIPFGMMNKIFEFVGVPANKRYDILDNMYVPFCFRYTEKEINNWLIGAGFTNLNRVKFERYDYTKLLSKIIHGEGWIQIYADKKIN